MKDGDSVVVIQIRLIFTRIRALYSTYTNLIICSYLSNIMISWPMPKTSKSQTILISAALLSIMATTSTFSLVLNCHHLVPVF